MSRRAALIDKYREYLPLQNDSPIVSLNEGYTPLHTALNLPKILKFPDLKLHFKLEGLNPTGSFKDRGMTMAISKAVEEGSKAVICASTGNTSASAAAYAARAGLACYVLLPAGKVALGKLAQAILYGATVIQIDGNFDQALDMVRQLADKFPLTVVNSINPYRLEGQKTGALEIVEVLDRAPDCLCIPVGNAGNISAYWRGFKIANQKFAKELPRMCGFQAAGAAPMVLGHIVENPETIATAIRIGNPASWQEAAAAASDSKGFIDCVTDDEILEAYSLLARYEGVFCEPASAASVAGLIKALRNGKIDAGAEVVCVLTGNGLKDPDSALKMSTVELRPVAPNLECLQEAMKLK
ncbi:MAG: threonine synthase [Candidatus Obscuribacterales bacterium]|nr:threonine synthase [Candidatus Obscuribacterales bacterium]